MIENIKCLQCNTKKPHIYSDTRSCMMLKYIHQRLSWELKCIDDGIPVISFNLMEDLIQFKALRKITFLVNFSAVNLLGFLLSEFYSYWLKSMKVKIQAVKPVTLQFDILTALVNRTVKKSYITS